MTEHHEPEYQGGWGPYEPPPRDPSEGPTMFVLPAGYRPADPGQPDLDGFKRFTYEEVLAAVTAVPRSTLEIWRQVEEPRVVERKRATTLTRSRRRHLFNMLLNLAHKGQITHHTGGHGNAYYWWKAPGQRDEGTVA